MRGPLGPVDWSVQGVNYLIQRRQLTLVGRGGQDDGKVKDLTKSRVGESLVAVEGRVKVPSDLVETLLDVDNEEKL